MICIYIYMATYIIHVKLYKHQKEHCEAACFLFGFCSSRVVRYKGTACRSCDDVWTGKSQGNSTAFRRVCWAWVSTFWTRETIYTVYIFFQARCKKTHEETMHVYHCLLIICWKQGQVTWKWEALNGWKAKVAQLEASVEEIFCRALVPGDLVVCFFLVETFFPTIENDMFQPLLGLKPKRASFWFPTVLMKNHHAPGLQWHWRAGGKPRPGSPKSFCLSRLQSDMWGGGRIHENSLSDIWVFFVSCTWFEQC